MTDDSLHEIARTRALQLPGAVSEYPFGPQTEVFKVVGKVFLLLGHVAGEALVTVKTTPHDSVILRKAFPTVTPGYHMNKRHWISIRSGALPTDLLEDSITESYLLVVAGLPKARQPVDTATFGQRPH